MPWYLAPDLVEDQIEWRFRKGERLPYGYTSPETSPKEEDFHTTFVIDVDDDRRRIPDLAKGPSENVLIVSQAFRALVEAMDPVRHHFLAAVIALSDGTELRDTHFIFKIGSFVDDGLDPEQSTVRAVMLGGKLVYYASSSLTPNLTWRASKVAVRHIWADRHMPRFVVVSDEFYAEMKRQGMGNFISKESRVDHLQ